MVQVELSVELDRTVELQSKIISQNSCEMVETDRKLGNFKDDFMQVLHERDAIEAELEQTRETCEGNRQMYEGLRKELSDCLNEIGTPSNDLSLAIRQLKEDYNRMADSRHEYSE
jgi:predicted  nucleic acid-binding Zn-ribbon protein